MGYKRALIKISGEALAGGNDFGFDRGSFFKIASEIASARLNNIEIALVLGGGNIFRGISAAELEMTELLGDHVGMLATVLNSLIMKSTLEKFGVRARVLSAFPVGGFVEQFEMENSRAYLRNGDVLVFAGGTGNPCFTTDSAAALRAVQIEAEVMIKATQVDGVFDKDPKKHSDAHLFDNITPEEVLARRLEFMDVTSTDILSRKKIPVIVLNLHKEGNILRALAGESVGTLVSASKF